MIIISVNLLGVKVTSIVQTEVRRSRRIPKASKRWLDEENVTSSSSHLESDSDCLDIDVGKRFGVKASRRVRRRKQQEEFLEKKNPCYIQSDSIPMNIEIGNVINAPVNLENQMIDNATESFHHLDVGMKIENKDRKMFMNDSLSVKEFQFVVPDSDFKNFGGEDEVSKMGQYGSTEKKGRSRTQENGPRSHSTVLFDVGHDSDDTRSEHCSSESTRTKIESPEKTNSLLPSVRRHSSESGQIVEDANDSEKSSKIESIVKELKVWLCPDCLICRYCCEPLSKVPEVEPSNVSLF